MPFRRADGVDVEVVDGRAVLLRADRLELVTLNATGSVVWELLSEPRHPADLVDEVLRRHPSADRAQVTADVERFVGALVAQELAVDAAG